jgi:hypothetical protein
MAFTTASEWFSPLPSLSEKLGIKLHKTFFLIAPDGGKQPVDVTDIERNCTVLQKNIYSYTLALPISPHESWYQLLNSCIMVRTVTQSQLHISSHPHMALHSYFKLFTAAPTPPWHSRSSPGHNIHDIGKRVTTTKFDIMDISKEDPWTKKNFWTLRNTRKHKFTIVTKVKI